jgi:methyl-accepting chemotaxis protein
MKISTRLTLGFLACGMLPLVISSVIGYLNANSGMDSVRELAVADIRAKASASLEAQQALKAQQVIDYFGTIRDQSTTMAENRMIVEAMKHFPRFFRDYRDELGSPDVEQLRKELSSYYTGDFAKRYAQDNDGKEVKALELLEQLDDDAVALQHAYVQTNPNPLGSKHKLDAALNDTSYDKLHAVVHPVIRNFLDKFGYYDVFLADAESGQVVYSVFKELDFSTSLKNGPYADSSLGEAFRAAVRLPKGEFALVDFRNYLPSYEAPAAFIGTPVYDGDQKLGVLLFQMPVDRIIGLMNQRQGLGATGEAILVGADRLMRCDSRLAPETHSLVTSFRNPKQGSVDSVDVAKALAGETGVEQLTDYRGEQALVAYGPIDLLGQRWCLSVKQNTSEAFAAADAMLSKSAAIESRVLWTTLGILATAITAVLALAWFVTRSICGPVNAIVARVRSIAEGEADLTRRLPADSNDELGELSRWFNVFIERIQNIIKQVSQTSGALTTASGDLSHTASDLTHGAEQTGMQSATVASAAEEMSASMSQMAATTEQMSGNVRSVAAATEQMTATINEIARNAEQSASVADKAARLAAISNDRVGGLGEAANGIGKVIEVIQDIAEQTNLLALNATIEAARAGEAGKGFAVVASEVKELAKQTAGATDDIRKRIEGIQSSTGEAIDAIREITSVISNVNEVARTIAAAVEEQSITTREIAENVSQTATAAESVVANVNETALASREITRSIAGVDQGAKQTAGAAGKTASAGTAVSHLADELRGLVSQFQV